MQYFITKQKYFLRWNGHTYGVEFLTGEKNYYTHVGKVTSQETKCELTFDGKIRSIQSVVKHFSDIDNPYIARIKAANKAFTFMESGWDKHIKSKLWDLILTDKNL